MIPETSQSLLQEEGWVISLNDKNHKSLKYKILTRLFLITSLIFLLVEILIIERTQSSLYKILDNSLLLNINSLLTLTEIKKDGSIDFEFKDEIMHEFHENNGKAFFLLLKRSDHTEIERSNSIRNAKLSLPFDLEDFKKGQTYFWNKKIGDRRFRCAATVEIPPRESERDEDTGGEKAEGKISDIKNELVFIVGLDKTQTDWRFYKIIEWTALSLATGLILLLMVVWIIINNALEPLISLQKDVEKITEQNLVPVNVPQTKEIESVAVSFNKIIKRLKSAFEKEKQFTSDVAHELRTPIAEMRTILEVAMKWKEESSENAFRNYEDLLKSAVKMQNMVSSLLTLSRCDSQSLIINRGNFNLSELIRKIVKDYEKTASDKRLSLKTNLSENFHLCLDESLFDTVLNNLVSNAVEYSAPGSEICITLKSDDASFLFEVQNKTDNLSREDLPYIFDRFWRKDKSRSDFDTHSGLGLSVVKSISQALHISLNATIDENSIFKVQISGPVNS